MKNLTSTSTAFGHSITDQVIDLDLSTHDPLAADAQASTADAANATSLPTTVLVTEDLVRLLKTDCIRTGFMPNRTEDAYKSISFDELCASISSVRRNTQPIQVRVLSASEMMADTTHQYELISGERRLRACIECELPVRAMIVGTPQSKSYDLDTLIENLHRADLSPYEFGRQILHVLATDTDLSLRRLALKLGRDASIVSRAKDIASLPLEVVAAFASCSDIRYSDAKPLSDAVDLAPTAAIAEAVRIGGDRQALKAGEIVALIVAAAKQADKQANGQSAAGGAGDEQTERPASNRMLTCAEREVGSLKLDKQGRVQVTLLLPLTSDQQGALAKQIESFILRRVLRIASEKKAISRTVTPDGSDNADAPPIEHRQTATETGGVA